jgi:conjugative transposon TraN protein
MKKINVAVVTGVMFLLTSLNSHGQFVKPYSVTVIEPYRLNITFSKTTHLVFPFAIRSVDRGSPDVLAQKVRGVENILEVKAGKRKFEQTNLTVVTSDGNLYSYLVDYSESPSVLTLRFSGNMASDVTDFSTGLPGENELRAMAAAVAGGKDRGVATSGGHAGMKFKLSAINIHHDVFYLRFIIQNKTAISYNIDQFRFFIRDQKRVKRTAAQELELNPIYTYGDTSMVGGHTQKVLVFALSKFTIPDQKYLEVQVIEKNGGRHLELQIGNDELVQSENL